MALNAIIKTRWVRLTKSDKHLGGLYDPLRGVIRFVSRDGTVDYDLVALAEDALKEEQVEQQK